MKKQILILMLALLLVTTVFADTQIIGGDKGDKICKVSVDKTTATEQITKSVQVPVTETKTISKVNPEHLSNIVKYGKEINDYLRLTKEQKEKATAPILKVSKDKTMAKTIQVPKYENKVSYEFIWSQLRIKKVITRVPIMETKQITTNQIKSGYNFDSDTGEFYKLETKEKC